MQVQDIAIADGKIDSIHTSKTKAEVFFVDWQETKWILTFVDVLAVENINVEDEELDRLEVRTDDPYIDRARSLVDEPDAKVNVYQFFTPWKEQARLRVIARDCEVKAADDQSPKPSP